MNIGNEQVTITQAELDQYKQFEEWVLDYIAKQGMPCRTFRSKFPDFEPWYNEHKNKAKRLAQQKKLEEKLTLLLPFLAGLPNPEEAGKGIILALSPGSTYSELLPKSPTPVVHDEEDEDEDIPY